MYTRKHKKSHKHTNDFIEDFIKTKYPEFELVDITQDMEVEVILRCAEGYEYKAKFRSLLQGRTPRFKTTIENVKQVCKNNGVIYIRDINSPALGNKYRITYAYDGRTFHKAFHHLKENGYVERLSIHTLPKEEGIKLSETYIKDHKRYVKGYCIHHSYFHNTWYTDSVSYCSMCCMEHKLSSLRKFTKDDVESHAIMLGIHDYLLSINNTITYTCENNHDRVTLKFPAFMKKSTSRCNVCTQSKGMVYTRGTIHNYENVQGLLYIIKFSDGNETFTKVGITSTTLSIRFRKSTYDVIESHVFPMNMVDAYNLEQLTLRTYKAYKYAPLKPFVGHTECLITSPAELCWFIEKEIHAN